MHLIFFKVFILFRICLTVSYPKLESKVRNPSLFDGNDLIVPYFILCVIPSSLYNLFIPFILGWPLFGSLPCEPQRVLWPLLP